MAAEFAAVCAQAEPFLRALFGNFYARGVSGYIEIRTIGPGKKRLQRFFPTIEAVVEALPGLLRANDAGANIYVGVNPRERKCGREKDVEFVVTLHVDRDWKKTQGPTTLALSRLHLEPSICVFSGHGEHDYFLLREPLHVEDEYTRALVRGVNAALATALGGDACHDLCRVLRLPGFRNCKRPDSPVLVQLQSANPERRYDLNEFNFLHSAPVPSAKPLPDMDTGANSLELPPRAREIIEYDPDVKLRWNGDPLGLNDTTRSGLDLSLASLLGHRGFEDAEIAAALRVVPYNGKRRHELTPDYLARTITKARSVGVPVHAPVAPIPLAEGKARIAKWLAFSPGEDLAIDVALATKVANDSDGDPVFVVLVGPSSGAKSEIIRAFKGVSGVYSLGSLTARTFASGLDPKKASLLKLLPGDVHTLALKDLGTILSMNPNERGDLLQQLRDIFDGFFRKDWGSGKGPVEWSGRLGLLAGATPAIEREFSTLAALGERFLFFRMSVANRASQARRALQGCGREAQMRVEIQTAIDSVLSGIPPKQVAAVSVPAEAHETVAKIAELLTQCRTPVVRNRYDKTVEYLPALEGPARAAKALFKLAQALAALYDHNSVGDAELRVLARIGGDSIPSPRARLIAHLYRLSDEKWSTAKSLGQKLTLPTQTVSRYVEDLAILGIVERQAVRDTENAPFEFSLRSELRLALKSFGIAGQFEAHHPESAERDPVSMAAHSAKSQRHTQPIGLEGNFTEGEL